jgi:hypothetical protein
MPGGTIGRHRRFWLLPKTYNAGILKFRQDWLDQGGTVSGMLRLISQKAHGEAQRQAKTLFSYGGRVGWGGLKAGIFEKLFSDY